MSSIVRLVFSMVSQVCRVMEKDMERHDKLVSGLRYIKQEMELVNALIKDDKECRGGAVQEIRIQQLQEFAYDVQDFVEGLWEPGAYGRRVLVAIGIGMDPRLHKLRTIKEFKERIVSLANQWQQSAESIQIQQGEEDTADPDPDPDPDGGEAVEQLVGIDGHKSKIVELLMPSPAEGQQLRVISIVGCRGVGKTTVAKAVYQECGPYSSHDFDCVAWVIASGCNSKKTLQDKILQSVLADLASRASDTEDAQAVAEVANPHLHDILSKKRCLVFIDDMQQVNVWKDTVDACPKNGSKSRIVVTTSVRSVATACSFGSYVYNMQCLSDDDSKSLFWRRVSSDYQRRSPPYSLETESESIFSKCGGLPQALTSVAKHLNMKGQTLDSTHFKEVGQNLGKDYLSGTNNAVGVFKGIRRALSQYYDTLPDYDHRSCMLYLSMFPKRHQIKSKTLLRKLMAEGLIVNEGCKCFDELIDRCIVEPVQMCNNSVVAKRCQVPAVVMEYIIQKSVAKNVVTLIQGNEPVIKGSTEACVRRLSIQSSTKERFDELEDKSALRSLTVTKTEPSDDLQRCKMLRLLDLEGCTGIDKLQGFIEGLSELQLLKYLNLRSTGISMLPTKIEKLQCLETLDIRDTKVEILPIQVIMLPKLAYLFGKFQLPDVSKEKELNKLSEFLKNKSVLHTLAGFVADKRKGPEHVTLLARNLKKVKVWFNDASAHNPTRLSPDLEGASSNASAPDRPSKKAKWWCPVWSGNSGVMSQNNDCPWKKNEERRRNNIDFIKLLNKRRVTPLESVSIVSSSGLCNDFLGSLEAPCTISSIKLRGNLNRLPDPSKLNELGRIKKLQLFSTGLTIKDLSALQYLRGLEYLKLVEHIGDRFCNGIFIVEENGFESLKSLCIDSPKVPNMQFKVGAMKSLTTLYLLCPNSHMPSGTIDGISHLTNLSEVILHSSMEQACWEAMANGHPNRPCVKRQPEPTANTAA